MSVRPRKTLPLELVTPNETDYERWWESERLVNPTTLSHDDMKWKIAWKTHRDNMIESRLIPNPTTSTSWIEPDITFMLRKSILDQ
tara:strand:+ start:233 stop:490 length:258 start_codon:yes stop_codon:yes gene_type:complete